MRWAEEYLLPLCDSVLHILARSVGFEVDVRGKIVFNYFSRQLTVGKVFLDSGTLLGERYTVHPGTNGASGQLVTKQSPIRYHGNRGHLPIVDLGELERVECSTGPKVRNRHAFIRVKCQANKINQSNQPNVRTTI